MGISVDLLREVDSAMVDTLRSLAVDPDGALQLRQSKSRDLVLQAQKLKHKGRTSGCFSCFSWC